MHTPWRELRCGSLSSSGQSQVSEVWGSQIVNEAAPSKQGSSPDKDGVVLSSRN